MFDLSRYMTAEERIELFAHHYPTFRMSSQHEVITDQKTNQSYILVKVVLFKDFEDKTPWVVGMAAESLTTPFAVEKAETSAYARCITATGDPMFSTKKDGTKAPRANREEMERVAAIENDKLLVKVEADMEWENFLAQKPAPKIKGGEELLELRAVATKEADVIPITDGVEVVKRILGATEIPECRHGQMTFKSGTNKQGKPYSGYVCTAKGSEQCPAKWNKN